jgi:hypothetical protein
VVREPKKFGKHWPNTLLSFACHFHETGVIMVLLRQEANQKFVLLGESEADI